MSVIVTRLLTRLRRAAKRVALAFPVVELFTRITHPERRFQRPEDWPESMKLWGNITNSLPD
jgi:hypothetical protein